MNVTKKLVCILAAGATLGVAAPAFADSGRERGYDHDRDNRHYGYYDTRAYRGHYRDYDRRVVVVRRPIVVERPAYYAPSAPVYYAPPAPVVYGIGPATVLGAVIGGYIDSRY